MTDLIIEVAHREREDINPGSEVCADGMLSSVMAVHRERGFDAGYDRAVNDVLLSLMLLTEEYLQRQPPEAKADLRRDLYAFEEFVERNIHRLRSQHGFVEGGLGI